MADNKETTRKKANLKNKILKFLYYKGPKSIPEISRRIAKTVPTTALLIESLLKERHILEQGSGDSSGGRKPNLYAINPTENYVFVGNFKQTTYELGIFNLNNELVSKLAHFSYNILIDNVDEILKNIGNYLKRNSQYKKKLLGAGIGMPGLINSKNGVNESYFKLPSSNLVDVFSKVIGVPVFIENDTRVMTVGEYRFGQAKGKKNIICVNYDKGIGIGFIFNGEVYHGKTGYAGEFGHMQIIPKGTLCYCGKQGCLETVASGRFILNEVMTAVKDGIPSQLTKILADKNKPDIDDLLKAVRLGDEFAINLISNASAELGRGLAMLVHLLNPEIIIIGGKLAEAGKYIQNPVQHALDKYTLASIHDDVIVSISKLGDKAIFMGLISTVVEKCLE
jgi:N-acetylglucosamine repressor